MDGAVARRMWLVGEPIHAVTYFAPESFAAWEAAGVSGFWRGYFATRAAPFGAVGPAVVQATFFNFAPAMVERALPAVWDLISPAVALAARVEGAAAALRAIVGDGLDPVDAAPPAVGPAALGSAAVEEAAELAGDAIGGCDPAGRALFAANAALAPPTDPLESLWHALTVLREHRGDGHNAALVAAGLDGAEAHLLAGALEAGGAGSDVRRQARGWSDDEWADATARLRDRDLLDGAGAVTAAGRALHAEVEARTDEAALGPWRHLGPARTERLEALLRPWARAIARSGVVRFPNPMGLPPVEPR